MDEIKPRLFCDIETFSSEDLPKTGVHKYVEAEDFDIILLAYAWDDDPVEVLEVGCANLINPAFIGLMCTDPDPDKPIILNAVVRALTDPDIVKVAHNAAFERACLSRALGVDLPPEQWEDTAILSAMNGLPMSLEGSGAALQLDLQKMKEGAALIRYFCKPCKPTIANGGRTRNLPEHAPEKWATFREYCGRDVETEREIYKRLQRFPVPDWERRLQYLDARINERGVLVDQELAASAIAVDGAIREANESEMRRLTGLDNPNSVAQLKDWLAAVGIQVESLNKATVSELLQTTKDPTIRRVLQLRQLMGKTSTKKYQAMLDGACKDQRIRGLLQYYGAGRTGRFAGRRLQLQNLPQNHLDDIADVRQLVRARDVETLGMTFDNVPDVLSQLIRTGLIAKPGHTFLVADYSAIEARVVAYLAGEKWRLDAFARGEDIYCSSASLMFGVPVEKHGINGHLRQKGKVAELACIAEHSPVLTDRGLVPIEDVTQDMRVWDGVEWVRHDGVICRGIKEVITYDGLTATPDHLVWIKGLPEPVQFGHAAASGAHLVQTGNDGHPLRLGGSNQPGETLERKLEPLLYPDTMHRLRVDTVAGSGKPEIREVERLPELLAAASNTKMAGTQVDHGETEMREPESSGLRELWSAWNKVRFPERDCGGSVSAEPVRHSGQVDGGGQDRHKRKLCTGESANGAKAYKPSEPTGHSAVGVGPEILALRSLGSDPQTVKWNDPGTDHRGRARGSQEQTKELARDRSTARVYDIRNAGPRHRFTVSGKLVHNCGYGGGVAALKAFGADKMGLTEDEMQQLVDSWRAASPSIPRFWRDAERAAKNAIENPGRTFTLPCGVKYLRDADALRCRLPSGRVLSYWGAHIADHKGRPSVIFWGQNQTTRKWEKVETWGGKLVENIVQAYARDCLAVALLRLDAAGFKVVFHVHDEVVAEAPEGSRWQDMADIMGEPIEWAPGLLLRGDGYETPFYMKD